MSDVMTDELLYERQRDICSRFGAPFLACPPHALVSLPDDIDSPLIPINGLRLPVTNPRSEHSGWYIWRGKEYVQADDFFKPHHAGHLVASSEAVLPYLALAPGWRFLVAPGYVDVWFDATLMEE